MGKKKRMAILCGLLICITSVSGFLYGQEQKRQQIKNLPVVENMANFVQKGVTDDSWNAFVKLFDDMKVADYVQMYQDALDKMDIE